MAADADGAIPKVDDAPWPGFPADLTSLALVLATQSHGTVLIHEKLFESRLFFVDSLIAMGARIVLCDPHRAVVVGPSELRAAPDRLPRHPRRHGPDRRRAVRAGHLGDHERAPGGPRLRADRRAPPLRSARRSSATRAPDRPRAPLTSARRDRRARGPTPRGGGSRRGSPCARDSRGVLASRAGFGPATSRVSDGRVPKSRRPSETRRRKRYCSAGVASARAAGAPPPRSRGWRAGCWRGGRPGAAPRGASASAWVMNSTSTRPPRPNFTWKRPGVSLPSSRSIRSRSSRISFRSGGAAPRARRAGRGCARRTARPSARIAADQPGARQRLALPRIGPLAVVALERVDGSRRSRCPSSRGAGAGPPRRPRRRR